MTIKPILFKHVLDEVDLLKLQGLSSNWLAGVFVPLSDTKKQALQIGLLLKNVAVHFKNAESELQEKRCNRVETGGRGG
ncbi:hypothetical protein NC652_017113 [Populus alba x Populus x berolinensis]|nr:hypothetical protein NC652_017113 [Populus alba x Populus x berolinensis]